MRRFARSLRGKRNPSAARYAAAIERAEIEPIRLPPRPLLPFVCFCCERFSTVEALAVHRDACEATP